MVVRVCYPSSREADIGGSCKFKDSLSYIGKARPVRVGYTARPCLRYIYLSLNVLFQVGKFLALHSVFSQDWLPTAFAIDRATLRPKSP